MAGLGDYVDLIAARQMYQRVHCPQWTPVRWASDPVPPHPGPDPRDWEIIRGQPVLVRHCVDRATFLSTITSDLCIAMCDCEYFFEVMPANKSYEIAVLNTDGKIDDGDHNFMACRRNLEMD